MAVRSVFFDFWPFLPELGSTMMYTFSSDGRIAAVGNTTTMGRPDRTLDGRLLLPGLVDAHSYLLGHLYDSGTAGARARPRGFLEARTSSYRVTARLDAETLHDVARHVFVQMLAAGVTCVGELHIIHHQPDGAPYADPPVLANAVALAAREAGIRLCLLRGVSFDPLREWR